MTLEEEGGIEVGGASIENTATTLAPTQEGVSSPLHGEVQLLERPAPAEESISSRLHSDVAALNLDPTQPDQADTTREKVDELQVRAMEAYARLEADPNSDFVLAAYSEALESADMGLQATEQSFNTLQGAHLASERARANLTKQLNLYLLAASDIKRLGSATVSHFGEYRTYHNLEDIGENMWNIVNDFRQLAKSADLTDMLDPDSVGALHIIDKYLFDTRNIEAVADLPISIAVYEDPEKQGFTQRLTKEGLLPAVDEGEPDDDKDTVQVEVLPGSSLLYKEMASGVYKGMTDFAKRNPILDRTGENVPDVIVLQAGDRDALLRNHAAYQRFFYDHWWGVPADKRPVVIMHADGFKIPLEYRQGYEGFLFTSSTDGLRNTIGLARDLVASRKKPAFLESAALASAQQKLYDNSDLREWEHETADTLLSLFHIMSVIRGRYDMAQDALRSYYDPNYESQWEGTPPEWGEVKTVLDCGTGEGRIGGMLARMGINVLGIDISAEQLKRGQQRLKEEGEGLRGEREDPNLSYQALDRLGDYGMLPREPILNDEEASRRYLTAQADFLTLDRDLNYIVRDWDLTFQDRFADPKARVDRRVFLDAADPQAFTGEGGMFTHGVGFDMVLFNWHTFCELGSIDNMKDALRRTLNVMKPGATLVLEIPDRTVGPYAASLTAYHETHPDEPLGTIRDTTSTTPGEATTVGQTEDTPRYFPDRNELLLLLQSVGFEYHPETDVQTYLITNEDKDTGQKHLQAKELFITAWKSFD